MAAYKEQYYNLAESEMQDLIARAKKDDPKAQEELLKVYKDMAEARRVENRKLLTQLETEAKKRELHKLQNTKT